MLAIIILVQLDSKMYHWTKVTREEIDSLPPNCVWAVYFVLKMFMGSNGVAYPARETVAEIVGCSTSSVKRAVRELVDRGLLVRDGYEPKSQTARFKLPKANQGGSNLVQGGSNVVPRGGLNLVPSSGPNLTPNKDKENKENNNRKPIDPIFLLPRIDP